MKIDIVIPTYNRKEILLRAIWSVLDQSEKCNKIIIVDDNSNFDVHEYLKNELYTEMKNIIYLKNDTNQGAAKSRNIGVEASDAEYVAFLDADDYWMENKLEEIGQLLHTKPDLIYSDMLKIDRDGNINPSNKLLITENILEYLLKGWTAPNTSALIYKKDFFETIGKFDESLRSCQDHDLWFRASINNPQIKVITKPLYYFTDEDDNRISFDEKKRVDGALKFLKNQKELIKTHKGRIFYIKFYFDYILQVTFPFFLNHLKGSRYIDALKVFLKYFILNPYFYYKTIRYPFKYFLK